MISISKIEIYKDVAFPEYLKLPGYSHSFLKREVNGLLPEFNYSEKVTLGSLVDDILTSPKSVSLEDKQIDQAFEIAAQLKKEYGWLIDVADKQLSFTAELEFDGFKLPVRGRADFKIPNVVLDLKVSAEKNARQTIAYMGYLNALWLYCKALGCDYAAFLVYSTKTKKIDLIKEQISLGTNGFWQAKILKFGHP